MVLGSMASISEMGAVLHILSIAEALHWLCGHVYVVLGCLFSIHQCTSINGIELLAIEVTLCETAIFAAVLCSFIY